MFEIDRWILCSFIFYIKILMHFDNNRKKMEVYKYILMHHQLENRKNQIFHLFATYFVSCDIC